MTNTQKDLTHGLSADGAALVSDILQGYDAADCEPDERERALIRAAGECRDRLSEIRSILDSDGLTVTTTTGSKRAHPLLAEERNRQAVLAKLLGGIVIGDTSGRSASHVRAARGRWAS